MFRILSLVCLLFVGTLGGCSAEYRTFSCAPEISAKNIDADQYIRPATTAGTGYLHC